MIIDVKFATEKDMRTWDSTMDDVKTGKIKQLKLGGVEFQRIIRCVDCMHQPTCGYISTKPYEERASWFCADGEERYA